MIIVHEVTMGRIDYGGIKRGMKNECCRSKYELEDTLLSRDEHFFLG